MALTILSAAALLLFCFDAIKWVPTIAVFMLPVLYIFMLVILYSLAGKPAFTSGEKIVIIIFLSMLIGPLVYTGWFLHTLKAKLIAGRERLEELYQRPITGAALQDIYYHGEKTNLHKFSKILTANEKEGGLKCKISVPENLEAFYCSSLTTQAQRRKLTAWLKENQSAITELDRLLREEKYFKMPESFRRYDSLLYGILLPELNIYRKIARIYLLRIHDAADRYDVETALTAYRSSRRVMEYALDDHWLISLLVGIAIEAIRLQQLQIIIDSKMLNNRQIKQIIEQLKQDVNLWNESYRYALYGETNAGLNAILFASRPMNEYVLFETGYFSSETDFRRLENEFFDFNEYLLQFFLAPVKSVYSEDLLYSVKAFILNASNPASPEYLKACNNIPEKFIFSKLILVSTLRLDEKLKMIQSQQQAAIMSLCIELYRRKNSKLPESLHDLVPEFIDKIYTDPFTGKPMCYIKGEYQTIIRDYRTGSSPEPKPELIKVQGYRIYSFGPDKCDDNGLQGMVKKKWHDDVGFSVTIK
jgi:hypothetical protein